MLLKRCPYISLLILALFFLGCAKPPDEPRFDNPYDPQRKQTKLLSFFDSIIYVTSSSAKLKWHHPPEVSFEEFTHYAIFIKPLNGEWNHFTDCPKDIYTFTVTGLSPNTEYYFRLEIIRRNLDGSLHIVAISNELSIKTLSTEEYKIKLNILGSSYDPIYGYYINLSWSYENIDSSQISYFLVNWGIYPGTYAKSQRWYDTSCRIQYLNGGTWYYIMVEAFDYNNNSLGKSKEVEYYLSP